MKKVLKNPLLLLLGVEIKGVQFLSRRKSPKLVRPCIRFRPRGSRQCSILLPAKHDAKDDVRAFLQSPDTEWVIYSFSVFTDATELVAKSCGSEHVLKIKRSTLKYTELFHQGWENSCVKQFLLFTHS